MSITHSPNPPHRTNTPPGQLATAITNYTTQLIVRTWDDPTIPADTTIDQILSILHHPYLPNPTGPTFIQNIMFSIVRDWWAARSPSEKDVLRHQLSKEGVQMNKNNPETFTATVDGPAVFEGSRPEIRDPRTVWTELQRGVDRGVEGIAKKPSTKIKSAAKKLGDAVS